MTTTTHEQRELNNDTARLLADLRRLTQERDDIDAIIDERKAELRNRLNVGTYTIGGAAAICLQPNRRFSPETAEQLLPPNLLEMCRVTVVDAATAKKVLPPALYDACMAEVGEPKVVLR